MVNKLFVSRLHDFFLQKKSADKSYKKVWISDVDFGGWYHNGMYVLHLQTSHEIHSEYDEILGMAEMLRKDAPDIADLIWAIRVYDAKDEIYCTRNELLVLDDETAYAG